MSDDDIFGIENWCREQDKRLSELEKSHKELEDFCLDQASKRRRVEEEIAELKASSASHTECNHQWDTVEPIECVICGIHKTKTEAVKWLDNFYKDSGGEKDKKRKMNRLPSAEGLKGEEVLVSPYYPCGKKKNEKWGLKYEELVVVKREDLQWLINYLENLIDEHEGGDILKKIKEVYRIE